MSGKLDRIEALLESNAKNIEELTHSIRELKKCLDSNAKTIEVLIYQGNQGSEETKKYREIQRKDRNHVFQCMARLAAAQADYSNLQLSEVQARSLSPLLTRILNTSLLWKPLYYEVQADYLRHVEQIDDRLTEILNRTTPNPEA